jgi:hypothetical protein
MTSESGTGHPQLRRGPPAPESSLRGSATLACALLALLCLAACNQGEPPQAAEPPAAAEQPATADAPASPLPAVPAAPPALFPRGLVTHLPGVTPGSLLFNPLLSDTTYLIDNDGDVVHTWKTPYAPGGGMYLLPNGNLLRTGRDPKALGFRSGGTGGILQELDWGGNAVWEWRLSDAQRVQHHDIEPMPGGHLLVLAWEVKSADEARAVGRRNDLVPEQGLWPDYLLEIEPIRPHGARIVWEWHTWDHLIQDHDPEAAHFGDPAAHPHRIDINAGSEVADIGAEELAQLQALGYVPADATPADLRSDFLHTNAVAYHPRLDQIALSVPSLGEIWIIDHGTSTEEARGPGGDLLYRLGNPASYGRGDAGSQRFFYQHDVRWIPDGWEGAGNLTVFNNGRDRPAGPWSSVEEWTPPLGADGRYVIADGEPFGPVEPTWQFVAAEPTHFFAPFVSGAERLANGNTVICDGTGGRFLEVNRAGDILWEYRNPFSGDVRNEDGSMPQPGLEENPYAVFRATRIAADHPAVAGRALPPLDPQPPWFEKTPDVETTAAVQRGGFR